MQDTEGYKVELSGPGLNLKRELSEPAAHELLVWLLKGGKLQGGTHGSPPAAHVASADTTIPRSADSAPGALTSVREFMEEFAPRRVPDKIACFALYLREHRNQKEFSKSDLVSLFQEAADPLPKNLGRDLRWTQSIAWIAPAPSNRDNFYLTKKGEDAVRSRFPKEAVAKTRQPAQRRRQSDSATPEPAATQTDQPTSPES